MEGLPRVRTFLLFIYEGRADFFLYSGGGKPHCFVEYSTVKVCTGASLVKVKTVLNIDDFIGLFERTLM